MKQPWAWVSWLAAILVILSMTRNPLYLALILICILFVGISLRQSGAESPGSFAPWKLAVWIILLATLFNTLTSHYGATVLFTIPGKLPLISGAVTLEAVVYGAINGLVLTGMLASFSVLNLALPMRDLISLIPRAFFPVAVVTSIAVTYLPTTLRQFRQIREAQAVRGHQMKGIRDWLPLLMPLLVGGLEHAMQLAEAMTARGFATTRPLVGRQLQVPRLTMFMGIIILVSGWIAQLSGVGVAGLILMLAGAGLIMGSLWYIGRQATRTTYHRRPWSWKDWLTLGVVVMVVSFFFLPFTKVSTQTLFYEPYPALRLPPFSPFVGLAILGLVLPGVLVLNPVSKINPHRDGLKEVPDA
ncbi:MAG TPA: CbiQ family ECF transporter T component [Anaerolineales bacterium]|nr:CbiQ family ECF transporter T component [Anaerolineales bacterium]